ncbi:MAG: ABC transporter permease [Eubacteriales bacterium]|nr:ABC transporter permease [Eubacteriales bacterium]
MILSFKMALRSISTNKFRAVLTMLGIIIGVMALIVLVSLVNGVTSSVTDEVSSLGSDLVSVTVSDDKGSPIKLETLEEWMKEPNPIGLASPSSSAYCTGKFDSESENIKAYGVTPAYFTIEGLKLVMGRFLKSSDIRNHTQVCVVSNKVANDFIGYEDCVGQELSLDGMRYTIVGVLQEDESLMGTMLSASDVYIPYTSLMRLATSVSSSVTEFTLSAADGFTMEQLEDYMNELLSERFEEDDDAYSVITLAVLEDAMDQITNVLSILLGGIAGISLVVGGIGIMNIMMVTVTERTREIGIRKAIGASRGTILQQFLMEAVVLCMMGCAIGIFISWSILRLVSSIVASLEMSFTLDGGVVLLSVVFCFIIGIVFGLYPANKAAKMKPIDALHYGG